MSSLQELAQSFLSGYETLSGELHTSLRAPNCTYIFAPSSLKMPALSNTGFTEFLSHLKKVITSFPITAKEIHINEEEKQIVIWATGVANFREEVKDSDFGEWNYQGEYMFILNVDKDGKIERIVEFLDSLGAQRANELVARAMKKVEEKVSH